MANTLIAFSNNNNVAHYFEIVDDTGQFVIRVNATFRGAQSRRYSADVPATLPPGYYIFAMYRDSNDALRATGEFYWNGTDVLSACLLYTSPSPRDGLLSRMPSSA